MSFLYGYSVVPQGNTQILLKKSPVYLIGISNSYVPNWAPDSLSPHSQSSLLVVPISTSHHSSAGANNPGIILASSFSLLSTPSVNPHHSTLKTYAVYAHLHCYYSLGSLFPSLATLPSPPWDPVSQSSDPSRGSLHAQSGSLHIISPAPSPTSFLVTTPLLALLHAVFLLFLEDSEHAPTWGPSH